MSNSVDTRVVEMQFDNKQFEKHVQTSVESLELLKKSLDFDKAVKSLDILDKTFKNFSLHKINEGVADLRNSFSALGIMGQTVVQNITNSMINASRKMVNGLTESIRSGFSEYETQINAVQTILANTSDAMDKAGYSEQQRLDIVNEKLDELNHYADKTIYNFTQMTNNIGRFTAAGIELDTAVNSIQGIANLAAVSGSTSQQASTAMYQLSQAISLGALKLQDWNSVVNAGMGGEIFQKALMRTAKAMGVTGEKATEMFDKLEAGKVSFRDSLSAGWITSDVLTATLEQISWDFEEIAKINQITVDQAKILKRDELRAKGYGEDEIKEILNLAQTATEAATKVKTLTQLFDTLKEAMQSGWTQTWEYIIGDFGEAKELFTSISDYFGKIIETSSESRNAIVKEWKDLGGRDSMIASFWNIVHAFENISKQVKNIFADVFPPATGKQLYDATKRVEELTKSFLSFTEDAESSKKLTSIFNGLASAAEILKDALQFLWDGAKHFVGSSDEASFSLLGLLSRIGDFVVKMKDAIRVAGVFNSSFESVDKAGEKTRSIFSKVFSVFSKGFRAISEYVSEHHIFEKIKTQFEKLIGIAPKIGNKIGNLFSSIRNLFSKMKFSMDIPKIDFSRITSKNPFSSFGEWISSIKTNIAKEWNGFKDFAGHLFLDIIPGFFKSIGEAIVKVFDWLTSVNWEYYIYKAADLYTLIMSLSILKDAVGMVEGFHSISKGLTNIGTGLTDIGSGIKEFGKQMKEGIFKYSKKDTDSIGTTLLKIAGSILILVGAIYILSKMDTKDALKGMGIIAVIAAELLAISFLLGKMKVETKQFLTMAGALTLLLLPIKVLSSMNIQDVLTGMGLIAALMAELAIFEKMSGSGATGKKAFIGLAVAVNLLVIPIKQLGSMDIGKAYAGITELGVLLAELAVFMRLAGDGFGKKTPFLNIAIAVNLLVFALKGLGNIDTGNMLKGLLGLGLILTELSLFMRATGNIGKVGGLVALSIAMNLMVMAVNNMGKLKIKTILKGIAGLTGVMIAFGVMVKMANGMKFGSALVMFLGLAATLQMFIYAFKQVGDLNTDSVLKFALSLSSILLALSVAMKIVSMIPAGGAIMGSLGVLAGFAILIGGIGAIVVAIGALQQSCPNVLSYIETGGDVLEAIGRALGRSISGLLVGTTDTFPEIGTNLSNFMTNVTPFLDGCKNIDSTAKDGVKNLASAMVAISGAEILDAIASWWVQEDAITKFSRDVNTIADMLDSFATKMSGFSANEVDVSTALTAAAGMTSLVDSVPWDSPNWLKWAVGSRNVIAFGNDVENLADALQTYATKISGFSAKISDEDVTNSTAAASGLAKLLDALPDTGGTWQEFTGFPDLSNFGNQLPTFAAGMMAYAREISGWTKTVSEDAIRKSTSTAKGLTELLDALPDTGGTWQEFTGFPDLSNFGNQLPTFAAGMMAYAREISGWTWTVSEDAVEKSTAAAKGLAALAEAIPAKDGLWQGIVGVKDLGDFSGDIQALGSALSTFAASVATISFDKSETALNVLELIKNFTDSLDGSGSIWDAFGEAFGSGSKFETLLSYTRSMSQLGTDLDTFANGISNVSIDNVDYATKIFDSISTFVNGLEGSGAIWDWFGETFGSGSKFSTIITVSENMATFGENFSRFATGISDAGTTNDNFENVKVLYSAFELFSSLASDTENVNNILNAIQTTLTGLSELTIPTFDTEGAANAKAFITSLSEGIQNGSSIVESASKTTAESGVSGAKSTYDSWTSTGVYLGRGIRNGIASMAGAIRSAAVSAASGAIQAIQVTWSVHSPSRVGKDLGMFFDLGLAGGIGEYAKTVVKEAGSVGRAVVDSTKSLLTNLDSGMFDYIDPNPTIRPVMDLSRIQTGVDSMNALFAQNPMMSTGFFSGSSFARGVNGLTFDGAKIVGGNDNHDIVNELQILTDRFDDLSEAVANMTIVLDSGTLVGQTSAKMDNQLGTIAMRKNRGN